MTDTIIASTEQPDVAALDAAVRQAHDVLSRLLGKPPAAEWLADWYGAVADAEIAVAQAHEARDHVADRMTAESFHRFAEEDRASAERYRSAVAS